MLKLVLLGGAMLFAIPALAQTTSSSASPSTPTTAVGSTTEGQDQSQSTATAGMRAGQTVQTGRGGPAAGAAGYPPCTRARTDSCIQRGGRRR